MIRRRVAVSPKFLAEKALQPFKNNIDDKFEGIPMKIKRSTLFSIPSVIMLITFSLPLFATNKAIEPPMVTIPEGQFLMGSSKGSANQQPVHNVAIAAFQMAKYEVTVKEYAQFIKATGYKPPGEHGGKCMVWKRKTAEKNSYGIALEKGTWDDNFIKQNDFHPVLCVSSEDAQAYIDWLVVETGKKYRLPSESEWEYTARAGTNSIYFFGEDEAELCRYGNVFDQTGQMAFKQEFALEGIYAQCNDKAEFTSVVGMYLPNAYGLYDIIGNVGEILADCEHKTYQGAPSDGTAWTNECALNAESNKMMMRRGGAYGQWSNPSSLVSTYRSHIGPDLRSSLGEGFRLALDISDKKSIKQPKSTVKFAKSLAIAQKKEALRRNTLTPFPDKPTGLTLQHNVTTNEYQLSWQASSKQETAKYNVYKSETIGGKYDLIAQDISQLQFIDTSRHIRKHSYVVTALNAGKESLYSEKVLTSDVIKNSLDIVQAEDFNMMKNVTIGTITDKENIGGGLNLTGANGINKGDWTEYLIHVATSGFYKLDYQIASADGSNGFELLLNDNVRASLAVPATGGFREWKIASGEKIYIESGQYKVRINAIASGWKLNWFRFVAS